MAQRSRWNWTLERPCLWCQKKRGKRRVQPQHSNNRPRDCQLTQGTTDSPQQSNGWCWVRRPNREVALKIIKGSGPSLFGRNWLSKIRLIWPTIKKISNELDSVLDKRPEVSKDELGTLKGAKAQFFVEPGAVPKFHKLRPVPHAIKGAIEQELDRLENMGVLEKIRFSN